MTPMFSIFILAIKFDCLVLAIFQSFHLFVSFDFDKLPPPSEYMFQITIYSTPVHKIVSEVLKTWYFSNAFWSTCQRGSYSPPTRPARLRYWLLYPLL